MSVFNDFSYKYRPKSDWHNNNCLIQSIPLCLDIQLSLCLLRFERRCRWVLFRFVWGRCWSSLSFFFLRWSTRFSPEEKEEEDISIAEPAAKRKTRIPSTDSTSIPSPPLLPYFPSPATRPPPPPLFLVRWGLLPKDSLKNCTTSGTGSIRRFSRSLSADRRRSEVDG